MARRKKKGSRVCPKGTRYHLVKTNKKGKTIGRPKRHCFMKKKAGQAAAKALRNKGVRCALRKLSGKRRKSGKRR